MWYFFGLVWIAVMVAMIYKYTSKQRRRASERAQHMEQLLVELKANPRTWADAGTVAVPPAAPPVPQFSRKPRLLPPPIALLYYAFRTGLPDHEIFAGVALDEVLDIEAGLREPLTRKISQQRRLDLVVCTKQLEVVAAVIVSAADDGEQFAGQCLQAAGVRVVRVDPAAPPRHHQVHALVYG
jgi:hypothetical protein